MKRKALPPGRACGQQWPTSPAGRAAWLVLAVALTSAAIHAQSTPPSAPAAMNPLQTGDSSSIFTAFEEQLGLKLEARTAPYEVFVIDSVEMPTPD